MSEADQTELRRLTREVTRAMREMTFAVIQDNRTLPVQSWMKLVEAHDTMIAKWHEVYDG